MSAELSGPICLIVSCGSRSARMQSSRLRAQLREHGVETSPPLAVAGSDGVRSAAAEAVRRGEPVVVVAGGDGTMRAAASALANTATALGVIPLGTVNDFARNLGIPLDIAGACETIARGRFSAVDLGRASDDYFVVTASLGFSAVMQRRLTQRLKRLLGPAAYVLAGALTWRHLSNLKITVASQGRMESMTVIQAGVINGRTWMGGRVEIPGADLESGKLAFYAIPPQRGMAYLRLVRELRHGRFFQAEGLRAFTCSEVTVESRHRHHLVLDGDLDGKTPARLGLDPGALRVLGPE